MIGPGSDKNRLQELWAEETGSRDGETTQELKESRWFQISSTYKFYSTVGVIDMYRITRVEDVSVSRLRSASSWRCWQLAPRSSRLNWRKTWAPSTRGEESTFWESPEKDLGREIFYFVSLPTFRMAHLWSYIVAFWREQAYIYVFFHLLCYSIFTRMVLQR